MKRYILFFVLLCAFVTKGQTGINIANVSQHAALQVEAPDHDKGVLIPRLTTAERDAIAPHETDNGLLIYNVDEQCLNYWSTQEHQWKSISGKLGKAEIAISNCSEIKVYGEYKDGKSMDSTNFITLTIDVTKIDTYAIVVNSSPHNGYYYAASGEFLSPGSYEITLPAGGQPVHPGTDVFTVAIAGKVAATPCSFDVRVEDSSIEPNYRMNCSSVTVHGVYKQDEPLNSTHYIEVVLQVDPSSFPNVSEGDIAYYTLETNEVDGIVFKGQGQLNSSTILARLYGEGVPVSTEDKRFIIKSNSVLTSGICYANVRVVIPKKRLLGIANSSESGFNFAQSGRVTNKMITDPKNYGMQNNSIVFFEGFEFIQLTSLTRADAIKYLVDDPVDIVIIGFSFSMSELEANFFTDFLKRGGVLLTFSEANVGTKRLMSQLTGTNSTTVVNGNGAGAVYKFSNIDDPILNGPFGDVRGKHWGEDRTGTNLVEGLDTSRIIVYSDGYDWSRGKAYERKISAFRHKDYHLVYVGDGGFNASSGSSSSTAQPFVTNHQNFPMAKNNYGIVNRFPVYNSVFSANAIAWAIKMAEDSGINSNKGGK